MKLRALLLALALVFAGAGISSAAVTDYRETATNLSVAYPVLSLDDTVAAERINADIHAFVENYRAQFESGAFYRGELGYRQFPLRDVHRPALCPARECACAA